MSLLGADKESPFHDGLVGSRGAAEGGSVGTGVGDDRVLVLRWTKRQLVRVAGRRAVVKIRWRFGECKRAVGRSWVFASHCAVASIIVAGRRGRGRGNQLATVVIVRCFAGRDG